MKIISTAFLLLLPIILFGTLVDQLVIDAEQEDGFVEYTLAWRHYNDDVLTKNLLEAAQLYRVSAEKGFAPAQYELALMYSKGEGFNQNYQEAYAWINIATMNNGNEKCIELRSLIEKQLDSECLVLAKNRSNEILAKIEEYKKNADKK